MTARCVSDIAPGEQLSVVGDDPGMALDLSRWCEKAGHRLVDLQELNGVVKAVIERTQGQDAMVDSKPELG